MTSLRKSASLTVYCSFNPVPHCSGCCSHGSAISHHGITRQRRGHSDTYHTIHTPHTYSNKRAPCRTSSYLKAPLFRPTRRYASVAAHSSRDDSAADLHWPQLENPRLIPTPYEIFNQSRHEPYSKRRFFELVKIYHPDRQPSSESHTPELRLDRYRLIVAANAILSDPDKRYAYDRTGQGWARWRTDVQDSDDVSSTEYKYTTFHRWRKDVARKYQFLYEDDPMFCATWEDWERWYHRRDNPHLYQNQTWMGSFFTSKGKPQSEVYFSNRVFLLMVALITGLAGIVQSTRVDAQSQNYRERIMKRSEQVGVRLNEAREGALKSAEQSKDHRIKRWVQQRDRYDESEPDGRSALPGDNEALCAPGMTKNRNDPSFWQRQPEDWERSGKS